MSGIYLHIPFCRKACLYCDFHFSTNLANKSGLVDSLCHELEQRKDYLEDQPLRSIYFGGGTPSVLSPEELTQVLQTLHSHFSMEQKAEITFELNPEDASIEYLRVLKKLGINRLSIGLQSLQDEELHWMNRAHNAKQGLAAVYSAKEAGFDNISIDLIYGSKFQTLKSWQKTLQQIFYLNIQHISSYNLTIEGKTKLNHLVKGKQEAEVDSDLSASLFDVLMEQTQAAGFQQYEISNFCKPGFMAVHNSSYWKGLSYLGVGPAAHSYNGKNRRFNVRSNMQYIQAMAANKAYFEEEVLTKKDSYNEYILTRLRTSWGCDLNEIAEAFGEKYSRHFTEQLGPYLHMGFVAQTGPKIYLKQAGKHFADRIASDLFM